MPWLFDWGLVLLVVIWCSTVFFQMPQHRVLGLGFHDKAYRRLVQSNWIRTLSWTGRSLLVAMSMQLLFQ